MFVYARVQVDELRCVGAPRVAQTTAYLPSSLVLRPCMPVRNATYKITIDTNKSPVNLGDLFSGEIFLTNSKR